MVGVGSSSKERVPEEASDGMSSASTEVSEGSDTGRALDWRGAEQAKLSHQERNVARANKDIWKSPCVLLLALLILVGGIATLFALGNSSSVCGIQKKEGKENVAGEDLPSSVGSAFPISSGAELASSQFFLDLLDHSTMMIEEYPDSAQAKAYSCLLKDPLFAGYPDAQKIQRFALGTFYFSTNGKDWLVQSDKNDLFSDQAGINTWLSILNECKWYSTIEDDFSVCDEKGMYDKLVLRARLEGTIPLELALLKTLSTINLERNSLKGTIPPEVLQGLKELETLRLGLNDLSGSLPSELGTLSDLTLFSVADNNLQGKIPPQLFDAHRLVVLQLVDNELTGSLSSSIGLLSSARTIHLSRNNLVGTIPVEIGGMNDLNYLLLNQNGLIGNLPSEIGLMTGDKSKQIQPSDIEDGPLKRTLSREPGLRRLVVFRNQLSGPIPSEIGLLHRTLETAELAYNEFSSSMPTELGRLTNVEKLFLEKNFLTGLIVSEIGQMANLTFMDVSDNALSGPLPSELGRLSELQMLSVGENNLNQTLPSDIGKLTRLYQLDLTGNVDLSGAIPAELGALTRLVLLSLTGTSLTGTLPEAFCSIPDLYFDCSPLLCGCDCDC